MIATRIWAKLGIKPYRLEDHFASNDPDYEAEAADVIGSYLNPPRHATVCSRIDRYSPPGDRHGFDAE